MIAQEFNFSLADRDLFLMQIQAQIAAKRKYLIEKQKLIKEESKKNEFLEVVKNDYKKYYDYIVKQKQREMESLNILNQYLKDIGQSTNLSNTEIKNTKKEQKNILDEIDNIKKEIDSMIDITGNELEKID